MAEIIKTWQDFARVTIESNDLDPMYEVLVKARVEFGDDWVKRFCMNFLLCYHAGQAAKAAERVWTWDEMKYRYDHDMLQRGTERRYYRGEQGRKALHRIAALGMSPEDTFDAMVAPTYTGLHKLLTAGRFAGTGFGDYFVWKVMDLQTRVFDHKISLTLEEAVKFLPSEPRKCAQALWPNQTFEDVLEMVACEIDQYSLPFGKYGGGACGFQEAETILCMLKGAFITRKHKIGDDIEDKRKALEGWPLLQSFLPPPILGQYETGELVHALDTP